MFCFCSIGEFCIQTLHKTIFIHCLQDQFAVSASLFTACFRTEHQCLYVSAKLAYNLLHKDYIKVRHLAYNFFRSLLPFATGIAKFQKKAQLINANFVSGPSNHCFKRNGPSQMFEHMHALTCLVYSTPQRLTFPFPLNAQTPPVIDSHVFDAINSIWGSESTRVSNHL